MPENERTMLRFDWEEIADREITAILGRPVRTLNDGTVSWQAIALVAGSRAVRIDVVIDTDELAVCLAEPPTGEDWGPVTGLGEQIGKRLGWCWVGRNYLGYLDTFTIAFDGIDPACMFVSIASSLRIKKLSTV